MTKHNDLATLTTGVRRAASESELASLRVVAALLDQDAATARRRCAHWRTMGDNSKMLLQLTAEAEKYASEATLLRDIARRFEK